MRDSLLFGLGGVTVFEPVPDRVSDPLVIERHSRKYDVPCAHFNTARFILFQKLFESFLS